MINYFKGDVTSPKFITPHCIIIHGVNDTGTSFGSGVAGAITRKWPDARADYIAWGEANRRITKDYSLPLGGVFTSDVGCGIKVCHLVSQQGLISDENPKPAKRWAILKGLETVVQMYSGEFDKVTFVAPKIGSGLGGLSFQRDVKPLFELAFDNLVVNIYDIN